MLSGYGKAYGEVLDKDVILDAGIPFSIAKMSSSAILDLRKKMDARSGGKVPVVVETPSVGLVVPWVAVDGTLRSVAFVNTRIDVQKPLRIRLRGVPPHVKSATWRTFHEKSITVPVERQGNDAIAEIPKLSAWNSGWLAL